MPGDENGDKPRRTRDTDTRAASKTGTISTNTGTAQRSDGPRVRQRDLEVQCLVMGGDSRADTIAKVGLRPIHRIPEEGLRRLPTGFELARDLNQFQPIRLVANTVLEAPLVGSAALAIMTRQPDSSGEVGSQEIRKRMFLGGTQMSSFKFVTSAEAQLRERRETADWRQKADWIKGTESRPWRDYPAL